MDWILLPDEVIPMDNYYFYLSKNEIDSQKNKRKNNYKFSMISFLCAGIIVIVSDIYALLNGSPLFNSWESKLFGCSLGFILGILFLLLAKAFYAEIKAIDNIEDMWINQEGIHLMLPIGKENMHFIKFNKINKIIVWEHPSNPNFTRIIILLKFKFKRRIFFEPNDRIFVQDIIANKFLDAVKKATRGSVKIEYKRWGEI